MSRSLDFLYDDCAGRKLFGRNRQLAGPPQYAMPLCRSVLVLSPIGSISLSYNAIKCNIIDKMLELFQPPLVEWRAEPRTFDYDSLATWKIDRRWLNLLDAREIICANEGSGNALFRAVSEAHRGSHTTRSSPTLTGELQLRCAVASGELPDRW